MSSQIRITKTPDLDKVMLALKSKWVLMDEIEIVKMAINKMFQEQSDYFSNEQILGIRQSQRDINDGKFTVLKDKNEIKNHFNSL